MRRILATACVVAVSGVFVMAVTPALASTPTVSVHAGISPASVTAARNVANSVVTFRAQMNAVLANYLKDYGDRLSASELALSKELIAKADSSLDGIQAATARTSTLASSGASKARVLAASRAAEKSFTTSHDQALAALNQITPILQPKLGLFEALGARRDADDMLAKFATVGTKITALTKTVNTSR